MLELWPIWLFLLIPAIIILYLLKQKADDKWISSLYLWKEAFQNIEAASPWERLRNNLLMLLQILTMFILVFSIMSPYVTFGGNDYKNVIVMIDNSGSMNTMYEGDISRLQAAKRMAEKQVEGLKKNTAVTVLSCEAYPTILTANSINHTEVIQTIRDMEPTDVVGDMSSAVTLAASMMAELNDYQASIYTDDGVVLENLKASVINLSSEGINGTIDYVSHTDNGESFDILTKVSNNGTSELNSDINLYLGDTLFDIQEVKLLSGESTIVYFESIPYDRLTQGKTQVLKAELEEKDTLLEDNIAYDQLHTSKKEKILLVTEQNVFLEKAILGTNNIEFYKSTEADISDKENYSLIIYDGIFPKKLPSDGNLLFINPQNGIEGLFDIEETIQGVSVHAVEHEVTVYVEDLKFGLGELSAIRKPEWAESFLQYDKYSAGFIGNHQGRSVAVLGFDIHQTDLPLQVEFPILIHNLLQMSLDMHLLSTNKVLAGESVTVYTKPGGSIPKVVLPGNGEESLPKGKTSVLWDKTKKTGLYRFSQKQGDETIEEVLSVNFPSTESKLKNDKVTLVGDENKANNADVTRHGGINLETPLILFVLLLLLIEWFVYLALSAC